MRINPIIILNILITIFLIIAIMVIVLMVRNEMNRYYISAAVMISFLLLFILYTINKGVPTSNHTEEINQYKATFLYHQDYFTIVSYSQDQIIYWRDIEAIFLINSLPLDGEYHTMEYRIFLNKKPETIRKQPLKWYDKILPQPKQEKFPMIKIDNDYHIDFNTFYPSLEKFLFTKTADISCNKSLKTTGFYKIFDKGTYIDSGNLKEYREQAAKT